MTLNEWLVITIGAILVNNMVLARILGICPFLGVSKKLSTALGMSGALIFVMTIASFVAAVLYNCLLKVKLNVPALGLQNVDIGFTKLLLFIVVIAALVQIVEIVMQKFSPPLYAALGMLSSADHDQLLRARSCGTQCEIRPRHSCLNRIRTLFRRRVRHRRNPVRQSA